MGGLILDKFTYSTYNLRVKHKTFTAAGITAEHIKNGTKQEKPVNAES